MANVGRASIASATMDRRNVRRRSDVVISEAAAQRAYPDYRVRKCGAGETVSAQRWTTSGGWTIDGILRDKSSSCCWAAGSGIQRTHVHRARDSAKRTIPCTRRLDSLVNDRTRKKKKKMKKNNGTKRSRSRQKEKKKKESNQRKAKKTSERKGKKKKEPQTPTTGSFPSTTSACLLHRSDRNVTRILPSFCCVTVAIVWCRVTAGWRRVCAPASWLQWRSG